MKTNVAQSVNGRTSCRGLLKQLKNKISLLLFSFIFIHATLCHAESVVKICEVLMPQCPCDPVKMYVGHGGDREGPGCTNGLSNPFGATYYMLISDATVDLTNNFFIPSLNASDIANGTVPGLLAYSTNYIGSTNPSVSGYFEYYFAGSGCSTIPEGNLPCGRDYNFYFCTQSAGSQNVTFLDMNISTTKTIYVECSSTLIPTLNMPSTACVNSPTCITFTLDNGHVDDPYTFPPSPPVSNPSVKLGDGTILTYSNGVWSTQSGPKTVTQSVSPSGDYSFTYCHTYTSPGTYVVQVEQPAKCRKSAGVASRTITISSNSLNTSFTSQCGGIVNFNAGLTCPCANPVYTWNFGDGSPAQVGGASISHTYATAANYNVTVSACGLSSTVSLPAASIKKFPVVTVNSATICRGQSATLNAGGANTYLWSNGATTPSITVSPAVTTSYTVTGTALNGCSSQATGTVIVNALPNVTVNSATICSGQSATLNAGGASTYLWSTGATTPSITVSPASSTTYTVTGTALNGCSAQATGTVTVNPLPNLTVNSATITTGQSATLNASGASTYSWSPSTGLSATIGSSVVASPTVTTTYTVTGTDNNGCIDDAISIVTVNGTTSGCLCITDVENGVSLDNLGTLQLGSASCTSGAGRLLHNTYVPMDNWEMSFNRGRFGIGRDNCFSPLHQFHVHNLSANGVIMSKIEGYSGNSSTDAVALEVTSNVATGDNNSSILRLRHSNALAGASSNGNLLQAVGANNFEALNVKVNNRVGIGTNNPLTTLHIRGVAQNRVQLNIPNDFSANPPTTILFVETDDPNANNVGIYANARGLNALNRAILGISDASSSGSDIGVMGMARNNGTNGQRNAGIFGLSDGTNNAANTNGWNIGGRGVARNSVNANIGVMGEVDGAGGTVTNGLRAATDLQGCTATNFGVFSDARGGDITYGIWARAINSCTNQNWAGWFEGNVRVTGTLFTSGVVSVSDKKFKQNIKPITNATELINKINTYTYDFDREKFKHMNFPKEKQYGVLAQELETVLPELVVTSATPEQKDDQGKIVSPYTEYKGVKYEELIPLLIAGMKEQNARMEEMQQVINDLQNKLAETSAGTETDRAKHSTIELSDKNQVVLNQNTPNPFAEKTVITYHIPEGTKVPAHIQFMNSTGAILQTVQITETGYGTLTVFSNDLSSGTYSYNIIVDGKIISTKRMVCSK